MVVILPTLILYKFFMKSFFHLNVSSSQDLAVWLPHRTFCYAANVVALFVIFRLKRVVLKTNRDRHENVRDTRKQDRNISKKSMKISYL